MLKMVDGTGIIGLDMVCPLGGAVSPPQPPNYDNVEMEGMGSLTLQNSLKAPLERVELIGNSVQLTTTGKNLFDPKQLQGISGFTIEGNEITQSGYNVSTGKTLKQLCPEITPGTYILSANNGDFTGLFGITKPMYKKSAIEIVDEDLNRIVVLVGNPNKTIKYTLQIEKGNTVTPYEPYTGLKPSPSPEYPQEIKSAGKWNEEKQKYEIDVKVTGKNLIKTSPILLKRWSNNIDNHVIEYITLKPHTTYTLAMEEDTNYVNDLRVRIFSKNDMTRWLVELLGSSENKKKFTTKDDAECVLCAYHLLDYKGDVKHLQLVEGDISTPYEPYTEQTLTLTSDRPITKWDKLVEQGGQIGWLYQSRIEEYYGDTTLSLYRNGFNFLLNNKKISKGEGYCSQLLQFTSRENFPCIHFNMAPNQYPYTLNTQEIYGSTVSEIKEYLKIHPLHLVYKTETSDFIPLSESEQTQLRNLHSYNGTTHVFVDSGEVPCGIKLTYRKEK